MCTRAWGKELRRTARAVEHWRIAADGARNDGALAAALLVGRARKIYELRVARGGCTLLARVGACGFHGAGTLSRPFRSSKTFAVWNFEVPPTWRRVRLVSFGFFTKTLKPAHWLHDASPKSKFLILPKRWHCRPTQSQLTPHVSGHTEIKRSFLSMLAEAPEEQRRNKEFS